MVFVGGVRLFEDATLDHPPTTANRDTDVAKLWDFIANLVGRSDVAQIEKLEVVAIDPSKSECDCGAVLEAFPGKLGAVCNCSGAGAIVTFKNEHAAQTLRKQLSFHKGQHEQGTDDLRKDSDGGLGFCEHCCFNNRILKHIKNEPKRAFVEEEFEEGDEASEDIVTERQGDAFRAVLSTILGPLFTNEVTVIVEAILNKEYKKARETVGGIVHKILTDPLKKDSLPEGLAEKSVDDAEKLVEKALNVHVKRKPADTDHEKIKLWCKGYHKKPDEILLVSSDEEDERPEMESTEHVAARPVPERREVSKASLQKILEELKLEVDETTTQEWGPGMEVSAENQKGRLNDKLVVLSLIHI